MEDLTFLACLVAIFGSVAEFRESILFFFAETCRLCGIIGVLAPMALSKSSKNLLSHLDLVY
jgi:hypothetical protein